MSKRLDLLHTCLTVLADVFLLWVLYHYGLGDWQTLVFLLLHFSPWSWLVLGLVLFLLLYRSDYRTDLPLFLAGFLLGYWGEWWGTTRGVWTYWNGATPPVYLPPLWGIGLLTVYRLSRLLAPLLNRRIPRWVEWLMASSLILLPALAFAHSWPLLAAVDWRGRLDGHFFAGWLVGLGLLALRFDLRKIFLLYVCGTLLGGFYESFGTAYHEWEYITHEVPPLWIAPLWGLAAAAMTNLAELSTAVLKSVLSRIS